MDRYMIEVYNERGIMGLTVKKGRIFIFTIKEEKGFERNQDEVLAIMENQYKELGELIRIVKGDN